MIVVEGSNMKPERNHRDCPQEYVEEFSDRAAKYVGGPDSSDWYGFFDRNGWGGFQEFGRRAWADYKSASKAARDWFENQFGPDFARRNGEAYERKWRKHLDRERNSPDQLLDGLRTAERALAFERFLTVSQRTTLREFITTFTEW